MQNKYRELKHDCLRVHVISQCRSAILNFAIAQFMATAQVCRFWMTLVILSSYFLFQHQGKYPVYQEGCFFYCISMFFIRSARLLQPVLIFIMCQSDIVLILFYMYRIIIFSALIKTILVSIFITGGIMLCIGRYVYFIVLCLPGFGCHSRLLICNL